MATVSDFDEYNLTASAKENLVGLFNNLEAENACYEKTFKAHGKELFRLRGERLEVLSKREQLRAKVQANTAVMQNIRDNLARV